LIIEKRMADPYLFISLFVCNHLFRQKAISGEIVSSSWQNHFNISIHYFNTLNRFSRI